MTARARAERDASPARPGSTAGAAGAAGAASDVGEPPDPARMAEALRALRAAASAAGKKHPRVAVCGERAGKMWVEGKTDEAIRLEQLLNELAKQYDVDILCPYPLPQGQDDTPSLKSILAEHSAASHL